MAKTKTRGPGGKFVAAGGTALARRPATRVVVAAPPPRRPRRAPAGGAGIGGSAITGQRAIVAFGMGWADQAGHLARVPTIAILGTKGTIAVAAHFMSKNSPPGSWMKDLALVAGLSALEHVGREGLTGRPAAPPATSGVGAKKDPYEVQGDDDE